MWWMSISRGRGVKYDSVGVSAGFDSCGDRVFVAGEVYADQCSFCTKTKEEERG